MNMWLTPIAERFFIACILIVICIAISTFVLSRVFQFGSSDLSDLAVDRAAALALKRSTGHITRMALVAGVLLLAIVACAFAILWTGPRA